MPPYPAAQVQRSLDLVRAVAAELPETSERLSHGGPAWFVRQKMCFVMFLDDHHGDGRLAIWCAAPDGAQADMVDTEPARFHVPPYVGHRGWLGVNLIGIEPAELVAVIEGAYRTVAPARLVEELDRRPRS